MLAICPKECCRVCGDRSKSLHYGVRTCAACGQFFRRSIIRNRQYECEYDRQCSIVYNAQYIRKMCKHCRLDKCYTVGLRPEGGRKSTEQSNNAHRESCAIQKTTTVINIVQLSPSIYCKPRDELTCLDKLQINRRSINSFRSHEYTRLRHQSARISNIDSKSQLPDFETNQLINNCESKLFESFLLETEFYRALSNHDKTRLNHDYQLWWRGLEHAILTAQCGGVDRQCFYYLDGTFLSVTYDGLRQYYVRSGQMHDPDMIARLALPVYQYHANTLSRALQTAHLDDTEIVALLALLYTTNYNSVSTVDARQALLDCRQRIFAELWQHYESIGHRDPSVRFASLILLVDPIQTSVRKLKELMYEMHMGANRILSSEVGKYVEYEEE